MTKFSNTIIAEIGSVHDGSFGNALKLIDLAKEVGADAVKFQTHLADFEVTAEARRPRHFSEEDRSDYFTRTGFSALQWSGLKKHADEIGIEFISSVFSIEAVDLLDDIGVSVHKVPSGELTNIPLLEKLVESGKPVILSTGMSGWSEIDYAFKTLGGNRQLEIAILQCTSMYPCPPERVGLNVILEIQDRYGSTAGFSDHTYGPAASIAAAALGARLIEKHLTFSTRMYGSDAPYAMEPDSFKSMSSSINEVWKMNENNLDKDDLSGLEITRATFQGVLVASHDLDSGHQITEKDVTVRKSEEGLSPMALKSLIGKKLLSSKRINERFFLSDLVD